jgi:hypothetical protein
MNSSFIGDSYDLVKRFFCFELRALGYKVVVDPMFTGEWKGRKRDFFSLVGATMDATAPLPSARTALFVDPDTGVRHKGSPKHVSFDQLAQKVSRHALVFSFDQSFSRQANPVEVMKGKLSALTDRSCHAMYYDSHARFLFVSKEEKLLRELRAHLVSLGLPTERFLEVDA